MLKMLKCSPFSVMVSFCVFLEIIGAVGCGRFFLLSLSLSFNVVVFVVDYLFVQLHIHTHIHENAANIREKNKTKQKTITHDNNTNKFCCYCCCHLSANLHFVCVQLCIDDSVRTFSAWRLILIVRILNGA